MRFYISGLLLILALMLFCKNVFGSAFSDPEVPDGEQIIWRTTKQGGKSFLSTVTWRIRTVDDEQLYEINVDSIEQGKAEYVLDKSDLQLIRADIQSKSEEGMSRIKIESKGNRQKLSHDLAGKLREKEIEYEQDSYSVHTLGFSLRGFPFNKQTEVKIKLIPPLKPDVPVWAWKMWDSYVKLLGEEKVTVPAGTFNCYKLEVAASGGIIRRFTSQYYAWYTKASPHLFVKYQDKDRKSVIELSEIISMGVRDVVK